MRVSRRATCLVVVLAAACGSAPKAPPPTKQELWLQKEREALRNAWDSPYGQRGNGGNMSGLWDMLQEEYSIKNAWCLVLLGEWFLVAAGTGGDWHEPAHYFKAALTELKGVKERSDVAARETERIAAAARDGLARTRMKPRLSREQHQWVNSQRASVESAMGLEPIRARLKVADEVIEELGELVQKEPSDAGLEHLWHLTLLGDWHLVRFSVSGDDADRKRAAEYFETVVTSVGDDRSVEALVIAATARDGLRRAGRTKD